MARALPLPVLAVVCACYGTTPGAVLSIPEGDIAVVGSTEDGVVIDAFVVATNPQGRLVLLGSSDSRLTPGEVEPLALTAADTDGYQVARIRADQVGEFACAQGLRTFEVQVDDEETKTGCETRSKVQIPPVNEAYCKLAEGESVGTIITYATLSSREIVSNQAWTRVSLAADVCLTP